MTNKDPHPLTMLEEVELSMAKCNHTKGYIKKKLFASFNLHANRQKE
jgi:hypothetical protein